jgi:tetratricopeptide (TPR) repeat protein
MNPVTTPPAPPAAPPTAPSRLRRLASWLVRPRHLVLLGLVLAALVAGGVFGGRRLLYEQHLRAAREAMEDQDCDAARPQLDACLRLRPDSAEVYFVAARGLRRAGYYDDAADQLREYERVAGQTPEAVVEWAMLQVERGDLGQYEPFLAKRLDAGAPEATLILEALAQGSMNVYHLGRARHYLDRLLEREPESALGLLWLGWLYQSREKVEDALQCYRRALQAHPRQPAVRLRLAQLALLHDSVDEAVGHLEELRRRGYKPSEVLLALARCRIEQGDPAAARALLDELLAASPDDSDALVERGKLALQEGDAEGAERRLRRAVELTPVDRTALSSLVKALSQQGKTREADEFAARIKHVEDEMKRLEELTDKMAQAPSDAPRLWHEAGVICLRNGQQREALRWLNGALQIDPGYAPAHESLVELYQRAGQPALADQHRRMAAQGHR